MFVCFNHTLQLRRSTPSILCLHSFGRCLSHRAAIGRAEGRPNNHRFRHNAAFTACCRITFSVKSAIFQFRFRQDFGRSRVAHQHQKRCCCSSCRCSTSSFTFRSNIPSTSTWQYNHCGYFEEGKPNKFAWIASMTVELQVSQKQNDSDFEGSLTVKSRHVELCIAADGNTLHYCYSTFLLFLCSCLLNSEPGISSMFLIRCV